MHMKFYFIASNNLIIVNYWIIISIGKINLIIV